MDKGEHIPLLHYHQMAQDEHVPSLHSHDLIKLLKVWLQEGMYD
jgi:hypothetical protein